MANMPRIGCVHYWTDEGLPSSHAIAPDGAQ
jgi:hypothetical protein